MPSVFTIAGAETGEATKGEHKIGFCKQVKNPRTGCSVEICYVGKGKSRTGWKFTKGSTKCPVKRS